VLEPVIRFRELVLDSLPIKPERTVL